MTRPAARFLFILSLMAPASLGAWTLTKADVFPRLFSPNGDGVNDVVYFNVATSSLEDNLEGKVYDAAGLPVADIKNVQDVAPALIGPPPLLQAEAMVWDGKDGNGNAVRAGVYIYEIRGNGQSASGAVVVAK